MSGLVWLTPDDRTHVLPTTVLASHREASWTWRVLDRRGMMVGELDGVTGGSLEMSIHTDTRGSGKVEWAGRVQDMPVWDQIRLQPVYTATFPDGGSVEWPFGVYLPAVPRIHHGDGGHVHDVLHVRPALEIVLASLLLFTLVALLARVRAPEVMR